MSIPKINCIIQFMPFAPGILLFTTSDNFITSAMPRTMCHNCYFPCRENHFMLPIRFQFNRTPQPNSIRHRPAAISRRLRPPVRASVNLLLSIGTVFLSLFDGRLSAVRLMAKPAFMDSLWEHLWLVHHPSRHQLAMMIAKALKI